MKSILIGIVLVCVSAQAYGDLSKSNSTKILGQGVKIEHPGVASTASPDIIDWNEDGKFDILVGTYGSGGPVYVFLNSGTNKKPVFKKRITLKVAGKPISVAAG